VSGRELEIEHAPPRLGDIIQSYCDPGLAARLLGFKAEVPLHEGLKVTWDWFVKDSQGG
jgi:nucleoside-diphosphate-sugar epimerase